jgi:hypothetical protein
MDQVPDDLAKDMFGFTAPTEEQLKNIAMYASEALELEERIFQTEEYLKNLKKDLADIEERRLPQIMLESGMLEFKMRDGSQISVGDVIQGGFPKDVPKREALFSWLIKEGGQENIKDHFELHFTKGQYEEAVKLRKLLQANNVIFDEFENVHTQTLYAFMREKIREGTLPPFDDFGLRYFKKANIKRNTTP